MTNAFYETMWHYSLTNSKFFHSVSILECGLDLTDSVEFIRATPIFGPYQQTTNCVILKILLKHNMMSF